MQMNPYRMRSATDKYISETKKQAMPFLIILFIENVIKAPP